jgi:hypothetical protein
VRPFGARFAWLSITPEPEQELPRALATLRAGGPPPEELVERERARAEGIVLHGSRRQWLAYLRESLALARDSEATREMAEARAVVEEVIENHDNLALGLASRRGRGGHNGGPR